ncbi:hypothetical protein [Clostridium sp. LP20]
MGCLARVTTITPKSDEELRDLYELGYERITIGMKMVMRKTLSL